MSVLKPCESFLESKNFHSEPDRIFFHKDLLVFLDLLRAPQCLLPSRYSLCVCLFLSSQPLCFLEVNYFYELRRAHQK